MRSSCLISTKITGFFVGKFPQCMGLRGNQIWPFVVLNTRNSLAKVEFREGLLREKLNLVDVAELTHHSSVSLPGRIAAFVL